MIHRKLVWFETLAAVVAEAFVELVLPPRCAFKRTGFLPFFANTFGGFGIGVDFEVGLGRQKILPPFSLLTKKGDWLFLLTLSLIQDSNKYPGVLSAF